MSYKIHYFNAPGRAEVARLCLTFGGIPYEDVHYTGETFPEAKPKMPFGQVPVLELPDGRMLAQSGAIDRYVAKLAGLYPQDPLQAAFADQAVFLANEFLELLVTTMYLPTTEAKVSARQELLAGKGGEKLRLLNKLLEPVASGPAFIAGEQLCFADLTIFTMLSGLINGFLDGIPTTLLENYPALKAFRNKVASEPRVKAHYEKHSEGRATFKPDA
ncbi:hypothetical protein Agub_g5553 [Astrephomene gubernaculifera]|uniref:Glutathione S-transferase n=1 Tax=Astrephomene gubernaculifera TaxID=47775 RepID=A0AAD3DPP2_9CHLO|nr:hypothetical protein Agub_g5553 [Astrephomene gubernaculifera]